MFKTVKAWVARQVYLYRAYRTYGPEGYAICQMGPTGMYRVKH